MSEIVEVVEEQTNETITKMLEIEVYVPVRWRGKVVLPADVQDHELDQLAENVRDRLKAENFTAPEVEDILGLDQQVHWNDPAEEDEDIDPAFVVDLTVANSSSTPTVGPASGA